MLSFLANDKTSYQQVIEKTKGLSFRSYVLANNLARTSAQEEEPARTAETNNAPEVTA